MHAKPLLHLRRQCGASWTYCAEDSIESMLWVRFGLAFERAGQENTVAPSKMVAPIPMRVLSSTVAAWMMAPCPAAQRADTFRNMSPLASACSAAPQCAALSLLLMGPDVLL